MTSSNVVAPYDLPAARRTLLDPAAQGFDLARIRHAWALLKAARGQRVHADRLCASAHLISQDTLDHAPTPPVDALPVNEIDARRIAATDAIRAAVANLRKVTR